jgi:hypothetical protein
VGALPSADIAARISQCMLRDQAALRQVLQKIRRAADSGKPFDRLQSRLEQEAAQSMARRRSLPSSSRWPGRP